METQGNGDYLHEDTQDRFLSDRMTQISDHSLLVHNELIELRRALQISERENKRRELALDDHQVRYKLLAAESERKLSLLQQEIAFQSQQQKRREIQMQRDYSTLSSQLADIKNIASTFIYRARSSLAGTTKYAEEILQDSLHFQEVRETEYQVELDKAQKLYLQAKQDISDRDARLED